MRFFRSRIGQTVYGVWTGSAGPGLHTRRPGGQYFITSERFDDNPRRYTVRRYNPDDHTIGTVGEFMEYKTSQGAAKRAMRERDTEQAAADGIDVIDVGRRHPRRRVRAPAVREEDPGNGGFTYPSAEESALDEGFDAPSYGA